MTRTLVKLIVSFVCISAIKHGFSQIPKMAPNMQSPNAASLGLFGEVPVSHFTGVPVINIPLSTFVEGEIKIPVSLNYHASGFRPDVHPGWVGMGWGLDAGGMISRVVNGKPDDYNDAYNTADPGLGYDSIHTGLNNPNWNTTSYMVNNIMLTNSWLHDLQPDEFNFSFPGYSGQFYMDPLGNWKVKCDRPVKVSYLSQKYILPPFTGYNVYIIQQLGFMRTYRGFMITTEDGTQYIFGNTTNAIEYSIPFWFQHNAQWTANTWYLTQIIHPGGKQVTLTYERDKMVNQMGVSVNANIETTVSTNGGGFLSVGCSSSSGITNSVTTSYDGSLISPVYLKSIYTTTDTISFVRSESTELRYGDSAYSFRYSLWSDPNYVFLPYLNTNPNVFYPTYLNNNLKWFKLDQIRISTYKGIIKTFEFAYNNVSTERLKLLSVREKGSQGELGPLYTFTYDNSVALPGYLSNKVDHWGFYNGTYASVANAYSSDNPYYGYRNPNAAYLYAGVLNKITYPTGGSTEFLYEPHYYTAQVGLDRSAAPQTFGSNQLCGGLRIKKITSYGSTGGPDPQLVREFYYVKNYTYNANVNNLLSSGVLAGQIKYYFDDYRLPAYNDPSKIYKRKIFTTQSLIPGTTNSSGNHITYSEVVEKRADGSYTKYSYSNYDNGYRDEAADNVLQYTRTAYEPSTSKEEERGKLLKEEMFNTDDQLVKKREIMYQAIGKDTNYVESIKATAFPVCTSTPGVGIYEGTAYRRYTYSFLPNEETETVYDINGTNPIVTKRFITYHPNNLTATIKSLNSSGDTLKKHFRYAFTPNVEFVFGLTGPEQTMKTTLLSKNYLLPLEIVDSLKPATGVGAFIGGEKIALGTFNTTQLQLSKYRKYTSMTNFTESNFSQYDSYGNLTETYKTNHRKEVYLWGYKGKFPVVKVVGSNDYATISAMINPSVIDNPYSQLAMSSETDKIRSALKLYQAEVTSFTCDPRFGTTSMKDPVGRTTSYDYDAFARLVMIRDHENKVVRKFCYNYQGLSTSCTVPTLVGNQVQNMYYYKLTCGDGYVGSYVTYTIPANTHFDIGQVEANLRALQEGYANGQGYANSVGTCTVGSPLSISYYAPTFKNPLAITLTFTSESSGTQYVRTTVAGVSSGTLQGGAIPPGVYTVQISNPNSGSHFYDLCTGGVGGQGQQTVYNIIIHPNCTEYFLN